MGTQPRLPGTMPSPAEARKRHRLSVASERQAIDMEAAARAALREAVKARKEAEAARRSAEDDLDAIDEGRRPAR